MTQTPDDPQLADIPSGHGTEPRGLANTPRKRSYDGRFGRLFHFADEEPPPQDPADPAHDDELRAIASAMLGDDSSGDNPSMPSGYVYLGQFIDHDLTFDPISQLQRRNDPEALINFRTPRFDLDSVYGAGPDAAPFLYDQTSPTQTGRRFLLEQSFDMPRNSQGRALIGDPRNDENGIVSQLHVAFLKLHNALMDRYQNDHPDPRECFEVAQRDAQWHYQWVVAHDFLKRVIGPDMHGQLLQVQAASGGSSREFIDLDFYRHKVNPYLPVEFSVAAYRFGHSQVRDRYSINSSFERQLFSLGGDDFRGFQPLRSGWQASWPFFFNFDAQGPQFSKIIDTRLASALTQLQGTTGEMSNLALRNLRRGAALGLPSGQQVATRLRMPPLDDQSLLPAPPGRAPLWFYVLREAEVLNGGLHLGPVGGRIVGETMLGLLRADPQSYIQLQPEWVPTLPNRSGDARSFDMVDLLTFAAPDQLTR